MKFSIRFFVFLLNKECDYIGCNKRGRVNKKGQLIINGRKKNVIVLNNGKNIYPEELEILISNLPYVSENFVFGLPKGDDLTVSAKIVYNKEYVNEKFLKNFEKI